MPQRETGWNSSGSGEVTNRRIDFQKSSQLFIRVRNETLSIVAMRVNDPDCSPLRVNRGEVTEAPTAFLSSESKTPEGGRPLWHSLGNERFRTKPRFNRGCSRRQHGRQILSWQIGFLGVSVLFVRHICPPDDLAHRANNRTTLKSVSIGSLLRSRFV